MACDAHAWSQLFAPEPGAVSAPELELPMLLLCKQGRPFLLFSRNKRAAESALELYPAQRRLARTARGVLRALYRRGLYLGAKRVRLAVPRSSPLYGFLNHLGESPENSPVFCSLAGNPNAAGQRFVFLLLDASGRPRIVVKAGFGEAALQLLEQERQFLSHQGGRHPGIPSLAGQLPGSRVSAFALPYFAPLPDQKPAADQIGPLLASWLSRDQEVAPVELPQWRRLEAATGYHPSLADLQRKLKNVKVHPAVYHGDFAPWNLRRGPEGLVVLDWERGEPAGVPGWDWFHFVVQDLVLVQRPKPPFAPGVLALIECPPFKDYAAAAGIAGIERELLLAYLLYAIRILRPSEGAARLIDLFHEVERDLFGVPKGGQSPPAG